MILTTITRQKCRPPASILGLRGNEKQVIDLEWPYSNVLVLIVLATIAICALNTIVMVAKVGPMVPQSPPPPPNFSETINI